MTNFSSGGISFRGHPLTLYDKKFNFEGSRWGHDGTESPSIKLWIFKIPISCDDKDVESILVRLGCVIRSSLILKKKKKKKERRRRRRRKA